MLSSALVEKVRRHVRGHFAKRMPKWLVFHDLEHTLSVTRAALDIGRGSGLNEEHMRVLEVAALFHDTGYADTSKDHEQRSAALATAFLERNGAGKAVIDQVVALIRSTRMGSVPRTLAQRVIRDADSSKAGQADFLERSERLRSEFEHQRRKPISAQAWIGENINYLRGHRFHTAYARRRFGRQKAINLRKLLAMSRTSRDHRPLPVPGEAHFFDRDLSWLAFNARCAPGGGDGRVPLLDRLKFLAIHSSNLDEFYRVRVAQLRSLRALRKKERPAIEVPPEKRIDRINTEALAQQRAFGKLYREQLLPALEKRGIRFLDEDRLTATQRAFVTRRFTERVAPLLQTASIRPGNAPFIEDRKLYLVCGLVPVRKKDADKRKQVLVNVPSDVLGRFIVLPSRGSRTDLLFLDDAIRLCAPLFFTGFKVTSCHAIKLSRDAELYLDEEFVENVADKVRRSLKKRRTGVPARFLYDGDMPAGILRDLRKLLGVKKQELIRGGRYHNLNDLMDLPVERAPALREPPLTPLKHPGLGRAADPFAAIRANDRLVHFPYHDFSVFTDLLRRAALDPTVTRISITLYRVARASLVCEALLKAVRAGKEVTAFVEVQARFDEGNNLFWGEALEQAGARVIYGREGLKVHCKLCLIERREGRSATAYCWLGTGNFNERTARLYGDMGLLTANAAIARDVRNVFAHLHDQREPLRSKQLMVAPQGLRSGLERLIDREIANALSGQEASILLKMNSLEDRPLIRKLYDASRSGVRIRLIVRGICCLVPGIPGLSENIEVISIVDRFLEHARAYVFHNSGDHLVFLSSADLMERNMDRRVEVAFPVIDPELRMEVIDFLELQWSDQAKARTIDAAQRNHYRDPHWSGPQAIRSQLAFYEQLAASAKKKRSAK